MPSPLISEETVKPLQAPRAWLIYTGIGTVLWIALGIVEVLSGAHVWRVIAYALLTVGSVFIFFWALRTVRKSKNSQL